MHRYLSDLSKIRKVRCGLRRQRERPVEVRHRSSVDQPAKRGASGRVGSLQPSNERVSKPHSTENPPDSLLADVDRLTLDEDEREGAGIKLRFEERLHWPSVPADGHDAV